MMQEHISIYAMRYFRFLKIYVRLILLMNKSIMILLIDNFYVIHMDEYINHFVLLINWKKIIKNRNINIIQLVKYKINWKYHLLVIILRIK